MLLRVVAGCVAVGVLAAPGPFDTAKQAATAAKHESYTESVPRTKIQFEMVAIPGGTFAMGSPASEAGRGAEEGPAHPVRVGTLWVARTETTWDQYDPFAFAQSIPAAAPAAEPAPGGADAMTRPTPPYGDESFG